MPRQTAATPKFSPPTVGEARALLTRASRRPVREMVNKIPTRRAIEILRAAFKGRPASSPISEWVADVVSLISCRHKSACYFERGGPNPRGMCTACGCFWCRRPT